MKQLKTVLILALVSMILLACGSGGSGNNPDGIDVPMDGKVSLSCAEATNTLDNQCSGERQALHAALVNGLAPSSIFNSGNISKTGTVFYELEAANGTDTQARVYIFIDEGGVAGCEDRNLTTMSSPFDVDSGKLKNIGTSGTGFDICAVNGTSWANVTIYNGSHLALDMIGDPTFDEALYTITILWNFID